MARQIPRPRRTAPVPRRAKKNQFKTIGVTEVDYKDAREMALLPYSPGASR